jgi:hypothetical protein
MRVHFFRAYLFFGEEANMALRDMGLTDSGAGRGKTTNFYVQYEDTLPDQANVIANANALLAVIENEFNVTTGWFNTPAGKFGIGNRQQVNLNLADTANSDGSFGFPGANNTGYGNPMNLDSQNLMTDAPLPAQRVGMVFIAEWSEVLMSLTGGKWNAGDSTGEGLSQFCDIQRFPNGHYNYYQSVVDQWLNGTTGSPNAARSDWVTKTFKGSGSTRGDGDSVSFGCALAFLYYLNVQLNFSINQILAAGASTLSAVYSKLTGDSGDPFPFFLALIENVYPASATVTIPGPVTDNPFPLAISRFWANKNTFGKNEVQEVINNASGTWSEAFWVVVEGFSESSFGALGVTVAPFTGSFATLPGVTITQNPNIDYENAASPQAPQRIRVPFDVNFSGASLSDFPSTGSAQYTLATFLTIAGTKVPGSDAATKFELVAGADPYFTNIDTTPGDPNQNNVFYLSQDLRVFAAAPAKNNLPVTGGPQFNTDSVAGAFTYVQQLLTFLNTNYNDPKGIDPFTTVLPSQTGALQGDSSVTPFTYDFSNPFNLKFYNNYNFAVARVRLLGPSGPSGAAPNVRVFFRLWATQSADTDYQTTDTYPSSVDSAGLPASPLVASDHHTIPFFASGNLAGNTDYGAGGPNTRDIQIPDGRDSIWSYYGCFLNLYDPANVVDSKQVQAWLTGTHHCIVAQIAEDQAPINNGDSPQASDKLAQRNLQITLSDNPGPSDTHRVPQTFDTRPSATSTELPPDELMIDWGAVPRGSVASIYWPQVAAADVIALASSLYSTHTLSAADMNTIQCTVTDGVTYVPIPKNVGQNFAGLFTIDLPQTVTTGQEFDVLVRRISTRSDREIILRTLPSQIDSAGKPIAPKPAKAKPPPAIPVPPRSTSWRYVVGTFAVKIPVSNAAAMLFPEENTLAIMRWRLQQTPPTNRWYPVLERYISLIVARVDGLGGDSGSILPSPTGVPPYKHVKHHEREYEGKVCKVLFDCFGDFEGFVLEDCSCTHHFKTRHRGIEKLVLQACHEQLWLCVTVDEEREEREQREERIVRLAIRC